MTHTPETTTTTPAKRARKSAAPRKAAAAKAPAKAPAKAAAAPSPARAASTVSKDGEMTCGVCERTLPVTKFPTTKNAAGEIVRHGRCRECRDGVTPEGKAAIKARVARKAAAAKRAAKAAK